MKKIWVIRRIIDLFILLSTMVFTFINFENITYYSSCHDTLATLSLNARYHNWLLKKYSYMGLMNPSFEIEHWTINIINGNVNIILFVSILLMMIISLYWGRKDDSKTNKKLRVYYVAFFIFMFVVTFVASPVYIRDAYDE